MSEDEDWQAWIGREERLAEKLDPARARALHATLGRPGEPPGAGDPLPALWHWIYFWTIAPPAALGPDGHPAHGDFLPPIDLPRRMWAGSRFVFHRPLVLGRRAERTSTVHEVARKTGRSGPLVLMTLRHRLSDGEGTCIEEEQDLVFRAAPGAESGEAPGPAGPEAAPAWRRRVEPDPVLLFRYSALTFNGHRIHYDRDYARGVEGYPGLVVHGPLLGTLMLEAALDAVPGARPARYAFRLSRPVFDTAAFTVAGAPADGGAGARLWVLRADGARAGEGTLTWA